MSCTEVYLIWHQRQILVCDGPWPCSLGVRVDIRFPYGRCRIVSIIVKSETVNNVLNQKVHLNRTSPVLKDLFVFPQWVFFLKNLKSLIHVLSYLIANKPSLWFYVSKAMFGKLYNWPYYIIFIQYNVWFVLRTVLSNTIRISNTKYIVLVIQSK